MLFDASHRAYVAPNQKEHVLQLFLSKTSVFGVLLIAYFITYIVVHQKSRKIAPDGIMSKKFKIEFFGHYPLVFEVSKREIFFKKKKDVFQQNPVFFEGFVEKEKRIRRKNLGQIRAVFTKDLSLKLGENIT
jgi:hypothetical protein